MTETVQQDEHDELSRGLARVLDTFRESGNQSFSGWERLCEQSGLTRSQVDMAVHQSRRRPKAHDGQIVVVPHGGHQPTDIMLTNDHTDIVKQRVRHTRISYAYALHVYWSEHQEWDRLVSQGAPQSDLFDLNYEMRKSQETIASQEAKIVSMARDLGLPDKKIATFFRVQVSPNDPLSTYGLVPA